MTDKVTLEESRAVYQLGYKARIKKESRALNPYAEDTWEFKAWDQGYRHYHFEQIFDLPPLHIDKI